MFNNYVTNIALRIVLMAVIFLLSGCGPSPVVVENPSSSGGVSVRLTAEGTDGSSYVPLDPKADPDLGFAGGQHRSAVITGQTEEEDLITVFVCGAVRYPDVYELPRGSRLKEAVEAAGGFTPLADRQYANLARVLLDEEMIRIYTVAQTAELQGSGTSGDGDDHQDSSQTRVNINKATKE